MKVRVPKKFKLLGHTITVEMVENLHNEGVKCHGVWLEDENKIQLESSQNKERLEHTFWHEASHAILDCMSSDLSYDEKHVDLLGGLIHQALSTQWGKATPSRDDK